MSIRLLLAAAFYLWAIPADTVVSKDIAIKFEVVAPQQ